MLTEEVEVNEILSYSLGDQSLLLGIKCQEHQDLKMFSLNFNKYE